MEKYLNSIKNFIVKNLKSIIMLLCIICILGILEDILTNDIMKIDIIGYDFISKYLISDSMTYFFKLITNFGGTIFIIGFTLILLVLIKNKKINILIICNLISITISNILLKNLVQRSRPSEYRIIDESGYSFPSGHSMISMAFYGFLIYLVHKYIKNKYLKCILIIMLGLLIILIGLSRIYLGVHYTSDVIAGFLVSITYLFIYINLANNFMKEEKI